MIWTSGYLFEDYMMYALGVQVTYMFKYGGDDTKSSVTTKKTYFDIRPYPIYIWAKIQQGVTICQPVPLSSLPVYAYYKCWMLSSWFVISIPSHVRYYIKRIESTYSINPAYKFALTNTSVMYSCTFNLKGHMLWCSSVIMNWIRG